MLDDSIQRQESLFLARVASAATLEELESARVEALGRKGALTLVSKEMGKLAPEDRARSGKLLNAAKHKLEAALDAKKLAFESAALNTRLDAEWLDLTLPAPGPRRGHLHPLT